MMKLFLNLLIPSAFCGTIVFNTGNTAVTDGASVTDSNQGVPFMMHFDNGIVNVNLQDTDNSIPGVISKYTQRTYTVCKDLDYKETSSTAFTQSTRTFHISMIKRKSDDQLFLKKTYFSNSDFAKELLNRDIVVGSTKIIQDIHCICDVKTYDSENMYYLMKYDEDMSSTLSVRNKTASSITDTFAIAAIIRGQLQEHFSAALVDMHPNHFIYSRSSSKIVLHDFGLMKKVDKQIQQPYANSGYIHPYIGNVTDCGSIDPIAASDALSEYSYGLLIHHWAFNYYALSLSSVYELKCGIINRAVEHIIGIDMGVRGSITPIPPIYPRQLSDLIQQLTNSKRSKSINIQDSAYFERVDWKSLKDSYDIPTYVVAISDAARFPRWIIITALIVGLILVSLIIHLILKRCGCSCCSCCSRKRSSKKGQQRI